MFARGAIVPPLDLQKCQSGWQVFADADGDGQLDRGEVSAISGRDGTYKLTLPPGDYTILEVARTGWQITAPSEGSYTVTVANGDALTDKDFGNQETDAGPVGNSDFQITLSLSGLTASQQAIAEQAADRWEQVIVGDLPDVWYRGQTIDDVSITIRTQRMDGVGNVLGESGPEAMRAGRDGLPYLGTVVIDTADIAQMESEGELLAVLTHEIAHVLGFGTVWTSQGLLSGTRTSNPVFTGAQAVAEYNKVFGTSATGIPVEAGDGPGHAGIVPRLGVLVHIGVAAAGLVHQRIILLIGAVFHPLPGRGGRGVRVVHVGPVQPPVRPR